ncbi:hypothetical protein [Sphingopyxis sp. YF1]|nr:hypothetical protein [Sphingopyxis sp. YF1]
MAGFGGERVSKDRFRELAGVGVVADPPGNAAGELDALHQRR